MTINNKATLFLQSVSCLDHAYADASTNGTVQGGSFMASFVITGNIDPVENVVVDFSTLKKDIKNIIDHKQTGLDHKLWVFPTAWKVTDYMNFNGGQNEPRVIISNIAGCFDIPRDCIHVVEDESIYNIDTAQRIVKDLVQKGLEKKYPGIQVECTLSERPDLVKLPDKLSYTKMFNYSHGLKHSTSWACQNPVHGHLSFVTFFYDEDGKTVGDQLDIELSLTRFIRTITNTVYVQEENISKRLNNTLQIYYTTPERGTFNVKYDLDLNKIIVMPCETTIENLLTWLLENHADIEKLKALGVTHVAMSEGLQKGSITNLGVVNL